MFYFVAHDERTEELAQWLSIMRPSLGESHPDTNAGLSTKGDLVDCLVAGARAASTEPLPDVFAGYTIERMASISELRKSLDAIRARVYGGRSKLHPWGRPSISRRPADVQTGMYSIRRFAKLIAMLATRAESCRARVQ